ncbi:MAG TPA: hypothetical protein VFU90_09350, partial [Candidatus Tumulicola sp.]|nr:hypothetical protein [Candidatus Tumulicola sp.]
FIPAAGSGAAAAFYNPAGQLPTPIRHVVIIFQENRTPDYMFQDVPGANVVKSAIDSYGERVYLHKQSLAVAYDLGHRRRDFVGDYNGGKMNGCARPLHPVSAMPNARSATSEGVVRTPLRAKRPTEAVILLSPPIRR